MVCTLVGVTVDEGPKCYIADMDSVVVLVIPRYGRVENAGMKGILLDYDE